MFFVRTDSKVFEALFNQSVDPISITRRDGSVVHLNQAWQDVLGWTLQELSAESLLHFVHFNDMPSMLWSRDQLELPGTHSIRGELRFLHKDEQWRTLEFNATSFEGHHFTIYRDVDSRIQTERSREASQERSAGLVPPKNPPLSATCVSSPLLKLTGQRLQLSVR
jgi:PAS domain S-box-containing protein